MPVLPSPHPACKLIQIPLWLPAHVHPPWRITSSFPSPLGTGQLVPSDKNPGAVWGIARPRTSWEGDMGNLHQVWLPSPHIILQPSPTQAPCSTCFCMASAAWDILSFMLQKYLCSQLQCILSDVLKWENTEETLIMSKSPSCTTWSPKEG